MTWRSKFSKVLLLAGMAGWPCLLVLQFEVSLLKAVLGGVALAFVTPIVFVVFMDLVDGLRSRPPPGR